MSVYGGLFPLPPGSEPGEVSQEEERLTDLGLFGSTRIFQRTTPGGYSEVYVSAQFQGTTSATAGNRTLFLVLFNQDAAQLLAVGQVVAVPASTNFSATWLLGVSNSYAVGTTYGLAPSPSVVLTAGYAFRLQVQGSFAGDSITSAVALVNRYPLGGAAGQLPTPSPQPVSELVGETVTIEAGSRSAAGT